MAGRLEGKVALVTGGAAGLGRSHALTLASEGADVTLFDLGDGDRDAEPGYSLSRLFSPLSRLTLNDRPSVRRKSSFIR